MQVWYTGGDGWQGQATGQPSGGATVTIKMMGDQGITHVRGIASQDGHLGHGACIDEWPHDRQQHIENSRGIQKENRTHTLRHMVRERGDGRSRRVTLHGVPKTETSEIYNPHPLMRQVQGIRRSPSMLQRMDLWRVKPE